eukprot:2079338-Rhodomonas_salina.1
MESLSNCLRRGSRTLRTVKLESRPTGKPGAGIDLDMVIMITYVMSSTEYSGRMIEIPAQSGYPYTGRIQRGLPVSSWYGDRITAHPAGVKEAIAGGHCRFRSTERAIWIPSSLTTRGVGGRLRGGGRKFSRQLDVATFATESTSEDCARELPSPLPCSASAYVTRFRLPCGRGQGGRWRRPHLSYSGSRLRQWGRSCP